MRHLLALSVTAIALAACKSQEQPASDTASAGGASSAAASGEQTPDPGGKVVVVDMLTDDAGNNKFEPANFTAKKGDVLRYTLKTGAHNVHFLPDSNPGKPGLPPASDILQLPGQTHDVKITWGPGTYFYQCDPHALLGMVGHLTVQ